MGQSPDRIVSVSIKPYDVEALRIIAMLKEKAALDLGRNTFSSLVLDALKEKYSDE